MSRGKFQHGSAALDDHRAAADLTTKSTCKKDFGLYLSKITSFLVSQIVQQSVAAAVNNKEL